MSDREVDPAKINILGNGGLGVCSGANRRLDPRRYLWRPQLRDPADEMVLEAAVNGQAAAIVTFNQRDFLPQALSFGLQVLTPAQFFGGK